MVRKLIKRCAIAFAAWLPFFAIWLLVAMSFARDPFSAVLTGTLLSMGSAGLLGIAVHAFWSWSALGRQMLMGVWFYAVFAGISHAVQTRNRLHEKETLTARAEALAASARLDAIRVR